MSEEIMSINHVTEIQESNESRYLVLDTNILIAICDEDHRFHQQTTRFFSQIKHKQNIKPTFNVVSRFELQEYLRKKYLTKLLYAQRSKDTAQNKYIPGLEDISKQLIADIRYDFLSDKKIKELRGYIKEHFSIEGWKNFCSYALKPHFENDISRLEKLNISYVSLSTPNMFRENHSRPKWVDQEKIILKYGLAANDAGILNMLANHPETAGIITNDYDIIEVLGDPKFSGIDCYTFLPKFKKKNIA